MSALRPLPRRLAGDRRGATAIEFAILLPVMLTTMLGFMELGYNAYVRAVLQGSLNEAGRDSTLETADAGTIDTMVQSRVLEVANGATFTVQRINYTSFSDVGSPEDFNDTDSDGVRDPDECYEDENGNGAFDQDRGQEGQGGADDIVSYSMTATYPLLFPYTKVLGFGDTLSVTATTVLRNQPYGAQQSRDVECTL